jgi:hypothetical protein
MPINLQVERKKRPSCILPTKMNKQHREKKTFIIIHDFPPYGGHHAKQQSACLLLVNVTQMEYFYAYKESIR